MSNFKFTPKKGVLSNVTAFVRSTTATAALTAANGLETAKFLNQIISDGLDNARGMEEMAMVNMAGFFSEQLGEKITVQDIREGNLSEKISEASETSLLFAAKKGQYRKAKEEMKLQKKIDKLNKKIAALKEQK